MRISSTSPMGQLKVYFASGAEDVWGTGLGRLPSEAADLLVISVIGCVPDVPGLCWYP